MGDTSTYEKIIEARELRLMQTIDELENAHARSKKELQKKETATATLQKRA